ncbi:importin-5-like isoform X3 [Oscarella lobularis]|uniref:importin-5-like isoform X3 n=1 Tax=Oscarella lobularis TaxID=121494 RepID=UPI003313F634
MDLSVHFDQLLHQLLTDDNQVREAAESAYNGLPTSLRLGGLVKSLCGDGDNKIRQLSAVLLRKIALVVMKENDEGSPIDPNVMNAVRAALLARVQIEEDKGIRMKLSDAIAEWARCSQEFENPWQEVLTFLFESSKSDVLNLNLCSLRILNNFPGIFGEQEARYRLVVKEILWKAMDKKNDEVQQMAVQTWVSFVNSLEDHQMQVQFAELIPAALQIIEKSAVVQEDDEVMKSFIELAENSPKVLRPFVPQCFDLMLKICGTNELEDSWRHLGFEFIVSLTEEVPARVRKHHKYIEPIVQQALAFMVDLDDNLEAWSKEESINDEDDDSSAVVGETSLDRLACALGGKAILPHVTPAVSQMLCHSDWRYRHAGLMALSAVGEGCHAQMEVLLPQLVDGILPYFSDPHPRVRYACCQAIGQMATDFSSSFQKKFHTKVLPVLMSSLDDSSGRVVAHGLAAIVNFVEGCPQKILLPYLHVLLTKLQVILSNKLREFVERGSKFALEQVMTTLATVADGAEEEFIPYYDYFIPGLKDLLKHLGAEEHSMLKGRTIECISLIGLGVGKEKFLGDASEVMDLLMKTQSSEEGKQDDVLSSYLIQAWARMCKILGKDFLPYLPIVMPPILAAAKIEPEVTVFDDDDQEIDNDWECVTLADQTKFGIKTASLEDKATAFQLLVCYARDVGEEFATYLDEVAPLMVDHLKFILHEGVRTAAADSLPFLLTCVKSKGPAVLQQLWATFWPKLIECMQTEPDKDVLVSFFQSFCACIDIVGAGVDGEVMNSIIRILYDRLQEHFKSENDIKEKRKDEDYDEGVEEDLICEGETNELVLNQVSEVIHSLFRIHREAVLPYFNSLCSFFSVMLGPDRTPSEHQWSLCVFDDVLEFTGPNAADYQEYFLRPLLSFITDENAEVRQAAAYGCGLMAQHSGKTFQQACIDALPLLCQVCDDPGARTTVSSTNAMDNALSAIVKMCQYRSEIMPLAEILPRLLQWLPVTEDAEEAEHVYSYFCQLITSNNPIILGEGNSNLPRIISIFGEALHSGVLDTEKKGIRETIKAIITQVQGSNEVWSACLQNLTKDQHDAIVMATTAQG